MVGRRLIAARNYLAVARRAGVCAIVAEEEASHRCKLAAFRVQARAEITRLRRANGFRRKRHGI